ncbi:aldehyde oxidase 1-like [Maniola hyperantus]|uniref:aldehyde oxidase 1-like n=1 Tax=Aphantopus hyperantus TaxID=2795564 RepID=UPI003749BF85
MNLDVNLSVYADDGSVIITHGGIEMGQGVNSKAIQIASYILKVPMDKIKIKPNDSIIVPNCAPSGGSITSQNVGIGVRRCCEELLKRLEPVKQQMSNPSWKELIQKAKAAEVDLQVHAWTTSADVVKYHICGVAFCEVEIDTLTGEFQVRRVDLMEDVGQSVSPGVDIGQIEGAFMMGMGYWTSENLIYDPSTGELATTRTWDYHPPQGCDIPQKLNVYFTEKGYSTELIYGAKGTGEPAACMSVVVAFAIRNALGAVRKDCGLPNEWLQIDGPFTMDKICMATGNKPEHFKFY